MNGICVTVTHPDFIENDDGQRQAFAESFQAGWENVRAAEGLESTPVVREARESVQLFFSYDRGIRNAEQSVAATMATISIYVAHHNSQHGSEEILPAYGFDVERDVPNPLEAKPDESPAPAESHEQERATAKEAT